MANCIFKTESGVNLEILGHKVQLFSNQPPICRLKTDRSSQGLLEDGPILCEFGGKDSTGCEYNKQAWEIARTQRLDYSI